jgi:hypothetical protein
MKGWLLIFALLWGNVFNSNALSLEVVRNNYQIAVQDKDICLSMIQQLENNHESNVYLAYLGAFQTIWANHTFNPINKLNTFNKGKKNIDKAAKLSPNDVEIIFIRHSVQKNCPGFLGYNDNLKEDEKFLSKNRNSITSATLKNMIEKLLKS